MKFQTVFCLFFLFAATWADEDYPEEDYDQAIYNKISDILQKRYSDPKVSKCVLNYLQSNKKAENFYKPDLFKNATQLEKELDPYYPEADKECKESEKTPSSGPDEPVSDFPTWLIATLSGIGVAVLLAIAGFVLYKRNSGA